MDGMKRLTPRTGRRVSKTIAGTTTQFLYDGANPVQELSGAVLADLLTGLGIDEYFTRTDGSGRRTLLADALGSILALADDAPWPMLNLFPSEYSMGAKPPEGSSSALQLAASLPAQAVRASGHRVQPGLGHGGPPFAYGEAFRRRR
jgi:hypothetical protein